jgi:TonB family protein
LRALAEIAEQAYERERRMKAAALDSAPTVRVLRFDPAPIFARRRELVAAVHRLFKQRSWKQRYWLVAAIAVAVFVVSLVVRMSWRHTGAEIAASTPPARTTIKAGDNSTPPSPRVVAFQPALPASARPAERSRAADLVHKAADIAPAADSLDRSSDVIEVSSGSANSRPQPDAASTEPEPPPPVNLAASPNADQLPQIDAGSAPLPAFGGNVSQGITEASLIRKVEPMYPPQARQQGLAGSVTLDATVAEDGSVRAVSVVNGPSLLAAAAATAVRQWHYHPATLNGKPIQAQKRITVVFKY